MILCDELTPIEGSIKEETADEDTELRAAGDSTDEIVVFTVPAVDEEVMVPPSDNGTPIPEPMFRPSPPPPPPPANPVTVDVTRPRLLLLLHELLLLLL